MPNCKDQFIEHSCGAEMAHCLKDMQCLESVKLHSIHQNLKSTILITTLFPLQPFHMVTSFLSAKMWTLPLSLFLLVRTVPEEDVPGLAAGAGIYQLLL